MVYSLPLAENIHPKLTIIANDEKTAFTKLKIDFRTFLYCINMITHLYSFFNTKM